jgi:hypothetical protein
VEQRPAPAGIRRLALLHAPQVPADARLALWISLVEEAAKHDEFRWNRRVGLQLEDPMPIRALRAEQVPGRGDNGGVERPPLRLAGIGVERGLAAEAGAQPRLREILHLGHGNGSLVEARRPGRRRGEHVLPHTMFRCDC